MSVNPEGSQRQSNSLSALLPHHVTVPLFIAKHKNHRMGMQTQPRKPRIDPVFLCDVLKAPSMGRSHFIFI